MLKTRKTKKGISTKKKRRKRTREMQNEIYIEQIPRFPRTKIKLSNSRSWFYSIHANYAEPDTTRERDEDRYSKYSILDISVSRVSWRHRRTIIVHCDHVFTVLFLPCLDTQWLKGNDYVTMMSLAKATPPTALPHYAESSTGWVLQNATASLSVHPPLPSTHLCPRIVPRCKKLRG